MFSLGAAAVVGAFPTEHTALLLCDHCVLFQMTSSLLDPEGPFTMLNALRMLPPDASHTILICFSPHQGAKVSQCVTSSWLQQTTFNSSTLPN